MYLLKAHSPVNRTGSPQGFSQVKILHIEYNSTSRTDWNSQTISTQILQHFAVFGNTEKLITHLSKHGHRRKFYAREGGTSSERIWIFKFTDNFNTNSITLCPLWQHWVIKLHTYQSMATAGNFMQGKVELLQKESDCSNSQTISTQILQHFAAFGNTITHLFKKKACRPPQEISCKARWNFFTKNLNIPNGNISFNSSKGRRCR